MLSRMQFTGTWRDYQAAVLAEFDASFADARIHVVAAPGAGKTVLGLELVRRLARPALVLAPTLAIREQWADRLCPLFLPAPPAAEEISRDPLRPGAFTLSTYQALNALDRGGGLAAITAALAALGPLSVVLDEAHHLRREWWRTLEQLLGALPDVRLVSLTATPPYDVEFVERQRYEKLCGPIDLEIGIPDLVRNGDLCPHQDHVILSQPTADALVLLERHREAIAALQEELRADADLLDRLAAHPWLTAPDAHVETILDAPEVLSAILVLLASAGRELPRPALELLGVRRREVPLPSGFWLQVLLDALTGAFGRTTSLDPLWLASLRKRLHRLGLIANGRVRLHETRAIYRVLAASLAKLDSIAEIAAAESANLGEGLRMVVLSDHLRAGELPQGPHEAFAPARLGVVPIFEALRRAGGADSEPGVLSGKLVILPAKALPRLHELGLRRGIAAELLASAPMPHCADYAIIEGSGEETAALVGLVTELFGEGTLRILVGTQALLGEGWDAPAVNSLVLASNTASFMASNQMRGRAIRIDPRVPDKVANIWHLGTIAPVPDGVTATARGVLDWGYLQERDFGLGSSDARLLARRFRAFEGVANGPTTLIESGVGRLGVRPDGDIAAENARTFALAADRPAIAAKWRSSLGDAPPRAHVRETAAPNHAPRRLSLHDTLHALAWSALASGATAGAWRLREVEPLGDLPGLLIAVGSAATVATLPRLYRAARLVWRNGTLEGSLRQVGEAVLHALAKAGLSNEAELGEARFEVRGLIDGRRDVVVHGVSRKTERLVMEAIAEVLGPVQNPRYLLVRRSRLGLRGRIDYHAVPAALAAQKRFAELFAKEWRTRVGSSDLVFTRNAEGRRVLLRARARSFAAGFQRSVDRRSAWL